MKKKWRLLIYLIILFCIYPILYQIYSPRVNAFGCFDDCFNYVAGYFLLKGRTLYSEIFFNHQPLMAKISHLVQLIFQPINIYALVLRHRQFVFLFGFLMNVLIVLRFGLVGLGFALFYEFTKFYLFGDRFLAEGLIVYPLVYLSGLVWCKFQKRKIYFFEYILVGFFVWLIIFLRTPFIPLALLTYILIHWERSFRKIKKISFAVFVTLTCLIFISVPFKEYIFNVFVLNLKADRVTDINILKSFFYPLYLFFGGEWSIFRHFILGLNLIFLALLLIFKKTKLVGIVFLLLGLANLRVVQPGRIFYEAFHLLPWYAMFILILFLMVAEISAHKRKLGLLLSALLISLFVYITFSPQSFIREEADPQEELIINFGKEMQIGEVVKSLSEPSDTLFLDGFDDLIYWQANRLSSYQYSWYTSFMPHIPKYAQARLEMFAHHPPDFYYGTCPGKRVTYWTMPEEVKKDYQQLHSERKPTCLYVRKTKIPQISQQKWQKASRLLYELP